MRNRPANINLPLGRKPPAPPFPPGATGLFGITTAPTLPLSLLDLVDQKSSLKTSWILQSLKKKKSTSCPSAISSNILGVYVIAGDKDGCRLY